MINMQHATSSYDKIQWFTDVFDYSHTLKNKIIPKLQK